MSADKNVAPEPSADIRPVMRHADLPDHGSAELVGPLIVSYLTRIRRHPRDGIFGDEPAIRFDPSWDDDQPAEDG
jgi:hypothetical protein